MGWSLRWSLGRIGGRGADAVREGFGEMGGSDLVGGVKVGGGAPVSVQSMCTTDTADAEATLAQIGLFRQNAARVGEALDYRPMWHILNSAGIERFPDFQFDMVRLGIGIYGISALPGVRLDAVASLKVKVLQVKHLMPEDGTIGYGRKGHVAPGGSVIATIPVGYADGIDRHLGCGAASFSIDGHRAPTIGNICMDMCMLDVTGLDVKSGDTVTVFGEDPTVSELASILGTIPYEILTSVPRRIERIIVR